MPTPAIRKMRTAPAGKFVRLADPNKEESLARCESAVASTQGHLDDFTTRPGFGGAKLVALAKFAHNAALESLRIKYNHNCINPKMRQFHRTMPRGWYRKLRFTLDEARELVAHHRAKVEANKGEAGERSDVEPAVHDLWRRNLAEAEATLAPLEAAAKSE
jgi:hypothetical protein